MRAAVEAGYGVTFISRTAVEAGLEAGRSPRRTSRAWPPRGRSRSPRRRGGPGPASRTRSSSSPAAGCRRDRPLGRRRARPTPARARDREGAARHERALRGPRTPGHRALLTGGRHSPLETVAAATSAAAGADGLVGVDGRRHRHGDAGRHAARAGGDTDDVCGRRADPYFGMRDEVRGLKTGGGARTAAAVYEPGLTSTSRWARRSEPLNARLAHAAEALYAGASEDATTGARLAVFRARRPRRPRPLGADVAARGRHARRSRPRRARALPRARARAGARRALRCRTAR